MTTPGGPGGQMKIYRPNPPERGSFPLDHEAECKHFMMPYLRCLKTNRGTNAQDCRGLAKQYLACRMEKNLMAPDEFCNLGFQDENTGAATKGTTATTPAVAGPKAKSGSTDSSKT